MPQKKTVFIAHPIAGDVTGNTREILQICEQVHKDGYIPVAPYLVSLQYLDDTVEEDRQLGIDANLECFRRRFIDELWLFGKHISKGMREEIMLARELNIPVIAKNAEIEDELGKLPTVKSNW
ncbi:MAG: DUF4406 domain-containing protein [Candidatus Paceibacterota bacterium]|jgi:cobalamin biosynthesis Mg chelatase CobN